MTAALFSVMYVIWINPGLEGLKTESDFQLFAEPGWVASNKNSSSSPKESSS